MVTLSLKILWTAVWKRASFACLYTNVFKNSSIYGASSSMFWKTRLSNLVNLSILRCPFQQCHWVFISWPTSKFKITVIMVDYLATRWKTLHILFIHRWFDNLTHSWCFRNIFYMRAKSDFYVVPTTKATTSLRNTTALTSQMSGPI